MITIWYIYFVFLKKICHVSKKKEKAKMEHSVIAPSNPLLIDLCHRRVSILVAMSG